MRDSSTRISEYVAKVKELGMDACALTEHGNMFSVMSFYKECKAQGIKPIIGVEAYILPSKEMATVEGKKIKHIKHHLTLLCKDFEGYRQLSRAVSKAQLLKDKRGGLSFPRMTYSDIGKYLSGGHIIAMSGCMQGEIAHWLLRDKYKKARRKALFYQSLFGRGNFYIELQNHLTIPEEQKLIPLLIKISRETGIPLVAANDCHYVEKDGAEVREYVVAMRFAQKVTDENFERDCGHLYVKSHEEMAELFEGVPEAIANTLVIANQCDIEFVRELRFPHFPKVPEGVTEDEFLRNSAYQGIYFRFPEFNSFPDEKKKKITERIETELEIITKQNYSGYLLIVADFILKGKELGLVGPGRGSAVGSLVCYLLQITDINPLDYGLLFERFLNMDRVSFPDIDTDFDTLIRDDVIEYVKDLYGQKSVCNIITFGSMGARAAIRSTGRVTGIPLGVCDRTSKLVPNKPGMTLKGAMEENPDFKKAYDTDAEAKDLIDKAMLMEGLVVQTGIHAAGVIIADRDITEYIPLVYEDEQWVSQVDFVTAEEYGLLKMDFLGLKTLTIIRRALDAIKKNHGDNRSYYDIPINDAAVIQNIFAKGRTKGVFQFESDGMAQLLRQFNPTSLEDLILLNAAYRPGPLQYLDEIIKAKNSQKKRKYICPEMAEVLDITYGFAIYQEQVMHLFHKVGGFSLGEADVIRHAMGKKKIDKLEKYLPAFKAQLIKLGGTTENVEKFCEELLEFGKYAFNKSHSTAYAFLAYITGYLKHYYPTEYMASVLTMASTKKLPVYIKECRDMGISVLPPSVNESDESFTAINGAIRFGLAGIKNVGKAYHDLLKERAENGKYTTLKDFIERQISYGGTAINKKTIESLIGSGAFDGFGLNRRQMLEGCMNYVAALKNLAQKRENPKTKSKTLENALAKVEAEHFDQTLPEMNREEKLRKEHDLIGFYASGHPLESFKATIDEYATAFIGDIDEDMDGKEVTLVGEIKEFQKLFRKSDGASMGKFTLSDVTGDAQCICFTKVYAEYESTIKDNAVVILKGKITAEAEADDEAVEKRIDIQIIVSSVEIPKSRQTAYLQLEHIFEWGAIAEIIKPHSGNDTMYVLLDETMYRAEQKINYSQELKEIINNRFMAERITAVTK